MFNVHLSYKPPSSFRILFDSEGCPRQLICLKKCRALVVPSGGLPKGIILHGRQLNIIFFCGRTVIPEKKRGCNRIVSPCTHI